MSDYRITTLDKLDQDSRQQVALLFVECFDDLLRVIEPQKSVSLALFEPCIQEDMFYICLDDGRVAGFLALSDQYRRTFDISKSPVFQFYGPIKGRIKKKKIARLIGTPVVKSPEEGYIDFVATSSFYRGKGIATKLIHYVEKNAGVTSLTLDVVGDNTKAIGLYKHLGFKTKKVSKSLFLRLEGIRSLLIMKKEIAPLKKIADVF